MHHLKGATHDYRAAGKQGNKLIIRAVGKLTDEDYKEVLTPRLE